LKARGKAKAADTNLKTKGKAKAGNAVNEDGSSEEPKQKDGDIVKSILEKHETVAAEGSDDDELLEIFQQHVKGLISTRCEKQKRIVKRMVSGMIDDGFDGIKEDIAADVMEEMKAFAVKISMKIKK